MFPIQEKEMELAVRGYDTKEQGRDPTAEELSAMQAWESLLDSSSFRNMGLRWSLEN
jgi:hypothetical protein